MAIAIKFLFLFSIYVLAQSSHSDTPKCPIFSCQKLSEGQCSQKLTDTNGQVNFNLQRCGENQDCNFAKGEEDKCQERVSKIKLFPGSQCSTAEDCLSNICEGGICINKDGDACEEHSQCPAGRGCIGENGRKQCKDLLTEGTGPCSSDYDCKRHLGCYNGICTKYFSLEDGSSLISVSKVREPLPLSLCKSGFEFEGSCASLKRISTHCTSSNECRYELNGKETFSSDYCECGYSNDGKKYCKLGSEDPESKDFISKAIQFLQSNDNCHTLERSGQCNYYKKYPDTFLQTTLTGQVYSNSYKLILDYHKYEKTDDCTKAVLIPEYVDFNRSFVKKCPIYSCDSIDSKCSLSSFVKAEGRNYVKLNEEFCPKGNFCNIGDKAWWLFATSDTNISGKCSPIAQAPTGTRYAGEKCDDNNPCYRGFCTNGACPGVTLGSKCNDHEDCNVGLYCNPEIAVKKCAPQLGNGSTCTNSYECQNNLVCLENRCKPGYYSIKTGFEIAPQEGFPMDLLCEFGTYDTKNNECSRINLQNPIDSSGFAKCEYDSQCLYNLNDKHDFTSKECECGYNDKGQGYCKPGHNTSI
jgi:hypothetical protein